MNIETQLGVVNALLFKIRKLENVRDAAERMVSMGAAGRGRTLESGETVEIDHSFWLGLLKSMDEYKS